MGNRKGIDGKIIWKKVYILLCVGYCLLMFPLLWISKYNHMCADDYGYGLQPHLVWLETGNVFSVLREAVQVAMDYYEWWQGTYSSIFLMALQPGIFGEQYYFLGALFLYVVFHVAFIYLSTTIFRKLLKGDKYTSGIATILILVVLIQFMETPVQAFYFYNAGIHYVFMTGIMWILTAMQIRTLLTEDKRKLWFYCLMQVLLGAVLGGGNFITAFLFVLTSFTLLALAVFSKKKNWIYCLPGVVFEVTGFIISAIAPGNAIRAESSAGTTPLRAIALSFQYSLKYIMEHVDVVVVLLLVLFLPLAWKLTAGEEKKFRHPLLVTGYTYCLYAAMFTPTCYALGYPGAGRCRNVYVMFLYLYLFFLEIYVVGWLRKYIKIDEKGLAKPIGIASLFVGVIVASLLLVQDANNCMSLSAVKSVYYKEAQLYHVIHLEREAQMEGPGQKITVRDCPIKPYLLFFDDITTDAEDWKNVSAAKWYRKKEIRVESD